MHRDAVGAFQTNAESPDHSVLRLDSVCKRYGRKQVINPISHRFRIGLTLLTGRSGSGKSTLMRVLATAEPPSSGVILWNEEPLPHARRSLRQVLGYAPQSVDLPEDLTAREFAMHMAALKGLDLSAADKQFLGITAALGLHSDVANKIATFSGGMRRRLIFAQALLGSPRLLILDEPTAELDRETSSWVANLVRRQATQSIVIMTTHIVDDLAGDADSILQIDGPSVETD